MSTGWRWWFVLLAVGAVGGGFIGVATAASTAEANEFLASGAPQQTVVALWMVQDLVTVAIGELIVLVVAFVSYAFWRSSAELAAPVAAGQHVRQTEETAS